MDYHILLTGATGLLGRYLLRDLLLADVDVAVLVRPSRRQSAEERVEALMGTWDQQVGRGLRRPIVLSGNICEQNLGMDDSSTTWVKEHCDTILHNAASLTFLGTDVEGEPWESNVRGTQNVLDLCEQCEIQDVHQVSTAYVCGLRQDRILESELEVGQEVSNDYERSKIEAENLVRSADFLSPPTVYRPSIIVGDSQTGFTTTFHGFYAMLRIAQTLVSSVELDETGFRNAGARLTLDGTESKNFVPVDWVSAVIAHIVTSPEHHGLTYHLTSNRPVTVHLVKDVLEESNNFHGTEFYGSGVELDNPSDLEQLFYDHIRVYNAYWRDDPKFDRVNTLNAAPHLPCPKIDREMLLQLARTAIDMNFRWKDRPVVQPSELHS